MESKQQEYVRRILIARMRVLSNNGFFGLLLMHMKFALDESVVTAATDGDKIYFAPKFLDDISDSELNFILMHEIMHVVLRHVFRTGERDNFLFNVACDIVVNSNILSSAGMDVKSISLEKYGESMHVAPNGTEGYYYTAEEVYDMLLSSAKHVEIRCTDNHSKWGKSKDKGLDAEWKLRIKDAYESSMSRNGSKGRGDIPMGVRRALQELYDPKADWRTLLNDFIQEEVTDYSFTPPDRRFADSPFLLPDFNETEASIRNVLFMVDTSGSMSEEEITQAYSEIKGAVDQFAGRLEGWLGFFDAAVVPPRPFADERELLNIMPEGGGGTSFSVIFDYIRDEMPGTDIASLIILTDGVALFPDESAAMGIPVMWMINNDFVDPPWGRVARI